MTWLHIGTSPSVLEFLPLVRRDWTIDQIVTCNRGILLESHPDVYMLIDQIACREFHDASKAAQASGTRLVTLQRGEKSIRDRGLEHFDEFLNESEWGPFRYTGPLCLKYASRQGATTILLVGCDGYHGDGTPDYFDGWTSAKREQYTAEYLHQRQTLDVLKPAFESVARENPGVEFVRYGTPCFQVSAGNWSDH